MDQLPLLSAEYVGKAADSWVTVVDGLPLRALTGLLEAAGLLQLLDGAAGVKDQALVRVDDAGVCPISAVESVIRHVRTLGSAELSVGSQDLPSTINAGHFFQSLQLLNTRPVTLDDVAVDGNMAEDEDLTGAWSVEVLVTPAAFGSLSTLMRAADQLTDDNALSLYVQPGQGLGPDNELRPVLADPANAGPIGAACSAARSLRLLCVRPYPQPGPPSRSGFPAGFPSELVGLVGDGRLVLEDRELQQPRRRAAVAGSST